MFRPLMLSIFRLYMGLSSSYRTDATDTTYVECTYTIGYRPHHSFQGEKIKVTTVDRHNILDLAHRYHI